MNLRQLRTFVLIAEHGSIRAAARALHLTQPAARATCASWSKAWTPSWCAAAPRAWS